MYLCGPVTALSLLSTPSTTKLLLRGRWPPTEPPVPTPTPPELVTPGASNERLLTPTPAVPPAPMALVWANSTTCRSLNDFDKFAELVSTNSVPPAVTVTDSVIAPVCNVT